MKNTVYLILLLGLLSCKNECFIPSEEEPGITTWIYEKKLKRKDFALLLCFDKNGSYGVFDYNKKTGKIEINPYNDFVINHNYEIENDSIFFNGWSFRYECRGQDSLLISKDDTLFRFTKFDMFQLSLLTDDSTKLPKFSIEKGFGEVYHR